MVLYIESPTQLMNSLRYLKQQTRNERVKLYIRDNGNSRQLEQYTAVLKSNDYPRIDIKFLKLNSWFKKIINLSRFSITLFIRSSQEDEILIGDLRSFIAKTIMFYRRKKKIVVVDDGLYLIPYLQKKKAKNNIIFFSFLPLSKYCENVLLKPIFTIRTGNVEYESLYIGSKYVEAGLLSLDNYLNILKEVKAKFCQKSNMVYLAHRGELSENLVEYEKIGFNILYLEQPLEEYIVQSGNLANNYISLYSSALFNLSCLVDASFISFKPDDIVWLWNKNEISAIYKLFNSEDKIQVI